MKFLWTSLFVVLLASCSVRAQNRGQNNNNANTDTVIVDDDSFERELCKGKGSEWFRLQGGEDNCRDVIQCTTSGLQAIRCPSGLAFDIEKQTCDWKAAVTNCDKKEPVRKLKPILSTDEPLCQEGQLACHDGTCLDKLSFCNGIPDCNDGSDENSCDLESDPNRAPPCESESCLLPDCFCSEDGTAIPNNMDPKSVPQMIMISFDDAINNNNIELYRDIFDGTRKNPNGCDIKATFFVSHQYSNYSAVQEIHKLGHEIAAHSITHNNNESFWTHASVDDWAKEMAGARLIIDKFANITDNSIVGMRAPYLRVGGNNQFAMIEEQAFLYDSTITVPLQDPPLWPYTLYFRMPHHCHGNEQLCPTRSHAVWEIVLNELDRREDPEYDEHLPGCAMIDSCSNILDGEQFYTFLNHNFNRHYKSNRAPLGLFYHAAWLKNNEDMLDAFLYWIDQILLKHNDVYFVTMTQVIQWMQKPRTINEINNFDAWKENCSPTPKQPCSSPNSCALNTKELPGETFNMQTCNRCPPNYPWLNDPSGDGFF